MLCTSLLCVTCEKCSICLVPLMLPLTISCDNQSSWHLLCFETRKHDLTLDCFPKKREKKPTNVLLMERQNMYVSLIYGENQTLRALL